MAICNKAACYAERTANGNSEAFLIAKANRILQAVAGVTLPPVSRSHRYGARSWHVAAPRVDDFIMKKCKKGCNHRVAQTYFHERIRTKHLGAEVRYTDGSKAANLVGLGVVGKNLSISRSLPDMCSVFSAEAAAVLCAVVRPSPGPIVIATDSASTVSALQSPLISHPWIQCIQDVLDNISTSVTFMWIPGHCGILGNEQADRLADNGRNKERLTLQVPRDDVRRWIKQQMRDAWTTEWNRAQDGITRKIKNTTGRWNDPPKRREQIVLSRLRTGHTRVSYDMTGGPNFRKICSICRVHNSVEHFLYSCPTFKHLRLKHGLGSIRSVLQDDSESTAALFRFLKDAQLLDAI